MVGNTGLSTARSTGTPAVRPSVSFRLTRSWACRVAVWTPFRGRMVEPSTCASARTTPRPPPRAIERQSRPDRVGPALGDAGRPGARPVPVRTGARRTDRRRLGPCRSRLLERGRHDGSVATGAHPPPRGGILIVEHLAGLEALPADGFRVFAVPPPVVGASSFPVRAFAEMADAVPPADVETFETERLDARPIARDDSAGCPFCITTNA